MTVPSQSLTTMDDRPLTAAEVRAQVNLIQEVMRSVMQDGQHYGKIPGCGDKPALLKPGAEKILATFRIAADPQVEDLSTSDCSRFRVICRGISSAGMFLGAGVGEASSDEEKYKWRAMICQEEFDTTPEDRRRVKFFRDGRKVLQVRTNPADVANTVLKMAKKRSQVDMALTVTAASDIFSQDIEEEDIQEHVKQQDTAKPPIQPPQRKSNGATVQPGRTVPEPPTEKPHCPNCNGGTRRVEGGISKKSGKAYGPFYSCENRDCKGIVWENEWVEQLNERAAIQQEDAAPVF